MATNNEALEKKLFQTLGGHQWQEVRVDEYTCDWECVLCRRTICTGSQEEAFRESGLNPSTLQEDERGVWTGQCSGG